MITLQPRTIQEYQCSFCSRRYLTKGRCALHEDKCYRNPNRNCPTCDNTGWESWDTLGPELGVIPDGDGRDCERCKIAKEAGGKSYIEDDNN